jgi:hypothetical protein
MCIVRIGPGGEDILPVRRVLAPTTQEQGTVSVPRIVSDAHRTSAPLRVSALHIVPSPNGRESSVSKKHRNRSVSTKA